MTKRKRIPHRDRSYHHRQDYNLENAVLARAGLAKPYSRNSYVKWSDEDLMDAVTNMTGELIQTIDFEAASAALERYFIPREAPDWQYPNMRTTEITEITDQGTASYTQTDYPMGLCDMWLCEGRHHDQRIFFPTQWDYRDLEPAEAHRRRLRDERLYWGIDQLYVYTVRYQIPHAGMVEQCIIGPTPKAAVKRWHKVLGSYRPEIMITDERTYNEHEKCSQNCA